MRLYGYWRSSSTWRVRIALAHKGLSVEHVPVDLRAGAQRDADYSVLNPAKQVPLLELEHNGQTHRVGQSLAILALLEQLYPEPALLPADAILRARAIQLAEIINAGTQPLQNLAVLQHLKSLNVDSRAWAQRAIVEGLAAFRATSADIAGEFAVGDEPSWADAALVPQLYNARRFDVDLADFPELLRIEASCLARAAFSQTAPQHMPDADR